MAPCSKNCQRRSQPDHLSTVPIQAESGSQPSMHRYIHPLPDRANPENASGDRSVALLRAVEEQNALLTDLLAAVNGLAALVCGRSGSA